MSHILQPLQLAKTCSTCKYARFGEADYRMGGKKQGGMCLRACALPLPKRPNSLPPLHCYSMPKLPELFKQSKPPTLQQWMDAFDKSLAELEERWKGKEQPSQIQERKDRRSKQEKYYHACAAWDQWWRDNYDLTRDIHRQTFCSDWEDGPKQRESLARRMVKDENKQG